MKKIEVAVVRWEEVDIVQAMINHQIAWDYDIITGNMAEAYYPAEKDDVFLELTQECVNAYDGSNDTYRFLWLECADLMPVIDGLRGSERKRAVLEYVKANIDRAIDTDETGGYW